MNRELAYQCALAFMVIVVIGLIVVMWREHPAPQVYVDKIPTSEPASVVPWVLNTRCPVNSKNLPHHKDNIA